MVLWQSGETELSRGRGENAGIGIEGDSLPPRGVLYKACGRPDLHRHGERCLEGRSPPEPKSGASATFATTAIGAGMGLNACPSPLRRYVDPLVGSAGGIRARSLMQPGFIRRGYELALVPADSFGTGRFACHHARPPRQ